MKTAAVLFLVLASLVCANAFTTASAGFNGHSFAELQQTFKDGLASHNPSLSIQRASAMLQKMVLSDAPTQACLAAYQSFQLAQANCPATLFILGFDSFQNYTTNQLASYCESNCATGMATALRAIVNACPVGNIGNGGAGSSDPAAFLNTFLAVLRLPCVTFRGEYCYPAFNQALDLLRTHQSSFFTDNELSQICTPCLPVYLKVFAELGQQVSGSGSGSVANLGGIFSFLNILCLRDNGQFCLNKFLNLSAIMEARGNDDSPLTPDLTVRICDRCTFRMYTRLFAFTGASGYEQFVRNFARHCTRNQNNELCWVKVFSQFTSIIELCQPGLQQQPPVCNSTCSAIMNDLVANGGCCATFLTSYGADDAGLDDETFQTFLRGLCNIAPQFPPACPRHTFPFGFVLRNLRYQYYLAHQAEVDAKIEADVATQAGVATDDVSISSVTASGEGTSVSVTISTSSAPDAASAQSDLSTAQSDGTFAFASVSSLPADSRVSLLDPAGATESPSSGAALFQPSFFMVLLAVALAFFF